MEADMAEDGVFKVTGESTAEQFAEWYDGDQFSEEGLEAMFDSDPFARLAEQNDGSVTRELIEDHFAEYADAYDYAHCCIDGSEEDFDYDGEEDILEYLDVSESYTMVDGGGILVDYVG